MTHKTIHPESWLPAKGYANGILTKDGILHIGGQIGWDGNKEFVSDDFIDQMRQALSNIRQIVETAGGQVEDVTRLTWFVTSKAEYLAAQKKLGPPTATSLAGIFRLCLWLWLPVLSKTAPKSKSKPLPILDERSQVIFYAA